MPSPSPAEIRASRLAAGLTQAEAAALIQCGRRAWMEWEAGNREMHPQLWECFNCKISGRCSPVPE